MNQTTNRQTMKNPTTSRRYGGRRAAMTGAALTIALLAGCATGPRIVQTEVTAFNQWSTLPGRSYVFSRTLEFENSLELKAYEDIVRDELAIQGFTLATDAGRAELVVTLRPSLTATRVRTRDGGFGPFYGGFGGFGGPFGRYGYGGLGSYGSFYGGPFYGGGFFNDFDRVDVDVYRHRFELDIDSRAVAGKRYYEGRVETSDSNSANPTVVPALIRALFTDFPGNNGQTRRVDVPVERVDRGRR